MPIDWQYNQNLHITNDDVTSRLQVMMSQAANGRESDKIPGYYDVIMDTFQPGQVRPGTRS